MVRPHRRESQAPGNEGSSRGGGAGHPLNSDSALQKVRGVDQPMDNPAATKQRLTNGWVCGLGVVPLEVAAGRII